MVNDGRTRLGQWTFADDDKIIINIFYRLNYIFFVVHTSRALSTELKQNCSGYI